MREQCSASGKIILSGEYAVLFGYPGIAVPSKEHLEVEYKPSEKNTRSITLETVNPITSEQRSMWENYAEGICREVEKEHEPVKGNITIRTNLPLGKGMGSSTALVIALSKALLGQDCKKQALMIEDAVNPGHSGLDFAVIWEEKPVLFKKETPPISISMPTDILGHCTLIDTGVPDQTTPELVAWVRTRAKEPMAQGALETIGQCTSDLLKGAPLKEILQRHHQAQVALGVVPLETQKLIADIERKGGAAKVIGAGARTGGGGMVLALS